MTAPTTPAEELRAAAERLRALGAKATPGPWTTELRPLGGVDPSVEECWVTGPLGENGRIEVARGYAHEADDENGPWLVQEDADWIATLSPAIANHQADLLDAIADVIEARPSWLAGRISTPALALVRAILAAAPAPSPTGGDGT